MKAADDYKAETGNDPWVMYAHLAGPMAMFLTWPDKKYAALKQMEQSPLCSCGKAATRTEHICDDCYKEWWNW